MKEIRMKRRNKRNLNSLKEWLGLLALTALPLFFTVTSLVYSARVETGNLDHYTGQCVTIHRREDAHGWFLTMDNDVRYFFNPDISDGGTSIVDELRNNPDKPVSITALPPHFLAIYDRTIVSLSIDGTVLLDSQITYKEFRAQGIVFLIMSIPFVLFLILCIYLYCGFQISDYFEKKRKKQKKLKAKKQ